MMKFWSVSLLLLLVSITQPAQAGENVPFAILKSWSGAKVKEPAVLVLKDESAYTKTFDETFGKFRLEYPSGKPPTAEKVDFKSKQVVAICWSAMPSSGYEISVLSVTGTAKEVTITVKAVVPKGLADPSITHPVVALVVPKTDSVRVIITGDRNPRATWWKGFSDAKQGLEVIVK